MTAAVRAELALLIDVGSAWAKASLIGPVRGRWRVITHVAQPAAWGGRELRRALARQAEGSVDPRLAGDLEELISSAPRIECHTPRRPARLALVAVSRELSGAGARRAAESAGWEVSVSTTLDDGVPLAERLAQLEAAEVDAWLLAGGFDQSRSPRALEAAGLAAAARRPGGGPVIWAGDPALTDDVAGLFETGAVVPAANPRPNPRGEDGLVLREELEEQLRRMFEPGSVPHLAPVAFRRAIGEVARAGGLRVVGVDIGARFATRVQAGQGRAPESRIFAGGGLAGTWLTSGGSTARVGRGLAHPIDDPALGDLLSALRARPASVPESDDELAVVHAVARAQLAAMADEEAVTGVDLLVGAGRVLAAAPSAWQAAQMLLDGLRPVGVTQLAVDAANLLGPLGALPDEEIGEGIGLLAEDLLTVLGTAVVCRGGEPGRLAMRVSVHRPGWPDPAPIELRMGQLQVVALAAGQEAELVIEPGPGVSMGAPRRSPRVRATATGGSVGLILDARGVPPILPRRADDRRAVIGSWQQALSREAAHLPGSGP